MNFLDAGLILIVHDEKQRRFSAESRKNYLISISVLRYFLGELLISAGEFLLEGGREFANLKSEPSNT